MVLSLQGRSHRFKSCSAHKGFSETLHIIYYYKIMKYKKDIGAFIVFLTFASQIFRSLRSDYTPTQVILTAIFAYLGMRLTYFVYSKNT